MTPEMPQMKNNEGLSWLRKAAYLYIDGFRNMGRLGKTLWIIILIKLFIFFVVLKLFFFPNYLNTHFKTEQERSDHVTNELIEIVNKNK